MRLLLVARLMLRDRNIAQNSVPRVHFKGVTSAGLSALRSAVECASESQTAAKRDLATRSGRQSALCGGMAKRSARQSALCGGMATRSGIQSALPWNDGKRSDAQTRASLFQL